jgi:putative membrane protein
MTRRLVQALLIVIAFALPEAVFAQNRQSAKGTAEQAVSKRDQEFVMRAAHSNSAEIVMGQLAQKNGASEAVRQFGRRMMQDHTLANKELEAIARKLGISVTRDPDPKHEGDAKTLSSATGPEFDRLYAGYMVRDHEMTVSLFQRQAKNGDSADLRQFAAKQLPILHEHLKLARGLMDQR